MRIQAKIRSNVNVESHLKIGGQVYCGLELLSPMTVVRDMREIEGGKRRKRKRERDGKMRLRKPCCVCLLRGASSPTSPRKLAAVPRPSLCRQRRVTRAVPSEPPAQNSPFAKQKPNQTKPRKPWQYTTTVCRASQAFMPGHG